MTKFLLSAVLIAFSLCASAQKRWNFELGAGMSQNSGNVENLSLKNYAELERNDSLISADFNYKFVYQKEDKEETNKGFNAGLNFDLFQYGKWSPFVATEIQTNKYKGYDFKISALTGFKYRIFTKKDTCDYSVSAAVVYDNVNYTAEENKLDREVMRISIRPKIKQKIGDNFYIGHSTFYQPSVKDFSDYIITSTTRFSSKITTKLFLEVSFNYEYRSKLPTEDYKNYDMTTEVSLKLKL
jgi:putative salt-induced outer membrane protein YdiY